MDQVDYDALLANMSGSDQGDPVQEHKPDPVQPGNYLDADYEGMLQ